MHRVSCSAFLQEHIHYQKLAQEKKVFVYPTDTIYGLGWIIDPEVVERITSIKQRPAEKHYSIIAPSFAWIHRYFAVSKDIEKEWYSQKIEHRGLTFLLPLRKNIEQDYNFSLLSNSWVIGVRMIEHPFQEFVTQLGQWRITTSANISWEPTIHTLENLTDQQQNMIDIAIDDGMLDAPASRILEYGTRTVVRA